MATISNESITVRNFIQTVLLNNIGDLIKTGNHYLGFGPQTQAIELIGAIIEDEALERLQTNPDSEFETQKKSRRRFHNALKLFTNPRYSYFCPEFKTDPIYQDDYDLYYNFRCGYAHQMRPLGKISVTTVSESVKDGTKHLEIDPLSSRLIIVSEILYQDLAEVCEKVIAKLDNGQIKHTKPYGNFLNIIKYA